MPMTNTFCTVLDTLAMARDMRPGQRNSLDALCKSYGIDNSHRELHGALLDAEILSDVYLMMTGGQTDLLFSADTRESVKESARAKLEQLANVNSQTLSVVRATMAELSAHDEIMNLLDKKSDGAIWKR
jgi:DNA polymerase-3 subunit epsilon